MKWFKVGDKQWRKLNRFGEVVDTITEAELGRLSRREREQVLRAPEDDGRHSS